LEIAQPGIAYILFKKISNQSFNQAESLKIKSLKEKSHVPINSFEMFFCQVCPGLKIQAGLLRQTKKGDRWPV
jgi:hypothetical protein